MWRVWELLWAVVESCEKWADKRTAKYLNSGRGRIHANLPPLASKHVDGSSREMHVDGSGREMHVDGSSREVGSSKSNSAQM